MKKKIAKCEKCEKNKKRYQKEYRLKQKMKKEFSVWHLANGFSSGPIIKKGKK